MIQMRTAKQLGNNRLVPDERLKKLPLLPAHRTITMMAMAAVTMYEAAVDSSEDRHRKSEKGE